MKVVAFLTGERLANTATIVICLCAFGIAVPSVWNQLVKEEAPRPSELPGLRGAELDSIAVRKHDLTGSMGIRIKGRRTVLYQFATTCPYCEAQKEFIGSVLQQMSRDTDLLVATASDEPPNSIDDYWSSDGFDLPIPLSIHEETVMRLAAFTVPRLYFINEKGVITLVLQGSLLALSSHDILEQVPPL